MSTLWTVEDLARVTGGRLQGASGPVSGIAIDNREVEPGDLFLALKGDNHDGHAFAAKALEAGAAALMVSRLDGLPQDAPAIVVDDTMAALQALGHAGRARMAGRVIAVTGSVGKTSTKDMLRTMLSTAGRTHAATRSFNNHWGVPLTLARMPADTEYAVVEIGMNHSGEIVPLSRMARPHVALITTVEAVHLEHFDSVEGIADAKAEIFAGLEPGGIAVLNADNPHFARLAAQAPGSVLSFGAAGVEARLISSAQAGNRTHVTAECHGVSLSFTLNAPGAHFVRNALGAILCTVAVDQSAAAMAEALSSWCPPAGRGLEEVIDTLAGPITLLDESYNANPASMGAALAVLAGASATGRKQAVLGDMLELGPGEAALHASLADLPAITVIDTVHCCGPRMRALFEALPVDKRGIYCANSEELAQEIGKTVDAGDVCMVKGSLGARMSRVVESLRALGRSAPGATDGDA